MFDNQGLPVTAESAPALAAFRDAMTDWLDYRLTAMPKLKDALERDPGFCLAHCLRGYMLMMYNSRKFHGAARSALESARAAQEGVSARERMHLAALAHWLEGDPQHACSQWEAILIAHPLDILALRLHHFVSFWMGRSHQLIAVPASVHPAWGREVANYGNVLGMMAFGLEEIGQYREAERFGREAVACNPGDLWAIHSVAHVLESQRRHKDGLAWLDFPLDQWDDRNPFRGHLWWHRGLYLMEAKQLDDALALYDRAIYDTRSDFYLDIQNAAAYLARLEFLGLAVGDRWQALADHAAAAKGDHVLVFTDMHNVISLARAGRFAEAHDFIASMQAAAKGETHVAHVLRRVGIAIAQALLAFEEGDYATAADAMLLSRPSLIEVGASHAQRDLVSLYAIEAARRSGKRALLDHLTQEREFMSRIGRADIA
ncbi:MAG: tetratricopeptide repeat protein [Hyphomicrobiaceae bacterium]